MFLTKEDFYKRFRKFLFDRGLDARPIEVQKDLLFLAEWGYALGIGKKDDSTSTHFPLKRQEVEGLKITVYAGEISEHLKQRVHYHRMKAEEVYKKAADLRHFEQLEKVNNSDEDQKGDGKNFEYFQSEAIANLEKADTLEFFRRHLILGADYILLEADLLRLEFIGSGSRFD